jgi:tetratricopeptide (TPR) repeat protein
MKTRITSFAILALAGLFLTAIVAETSTMPAAVVKPAVEPQALNPLYLSQFPSVEKIKADVRGVDAMETAAKQTGIFWQLRQLIYNLALSQRRTDRQFTADEQRLEVEYRNAHYYAMEPFEGKVTGGDKPKWYELRGKYELDRFLRDEVFKKYFTPDLRRAIYVALKEQMPTYTPEGSTLTPTTSTASSTAPPTGQSYLSQFPSVERVKAEIKGADALDTAARQSVAFWWLNKFVVDLAGPRGQRGESTPDELRVRLPYLEILNFYLSDKNTFAKTDYHRWDKLLGDYTNDPAFLDDLLTRFFSPEFRAGFYRATGTQPPQLATSQPTTRPTAQPTAQPSTAAGGSAKDYIVRGDKYSDAKDYDRAIEAYKKAISLQPSSDAYNELGLAYMALKQYANGVAAFQQGIRLKPDDPTLRLNLGYVYIQMKQYENAISSLREAIRLKPDYAFAINGLGLAYHGLEQYSEAVAAFQQAVRLAPNEAPYLSNLGRTYVEMGRKEEAIQVRQALQKLDPGGAKKLDEMIALFPQDDDLLLDTGEVFTLEDLKDAPLARRLFRRVIVLNKDPESVARAYRLIGDTYKEQQKNEKAAGAYQQAVAFYQKAIRLKPNSADAHFGLGSTYAKMGRKQEALQVHRTLQRMDRKQAQELLAEINKMK